MFEMSHLNSVGDIQIRERDVGLRNLSARFPATHSLKNFLPRSAQGLVWVDPVRCGHFAFGKTACAPSLQARGVKR